MDFSLSFERTFKFMDFNPGSQHLFGSRKKSSQRKQKRFRKQAVLGIVAIMSKHSEPYEIDLRTHLDQRANETLGMCPHPFGWRAPWPCSLVAAVSWSCFRWDF